MDLRYFFACSSFCLEFQEMRGMNIPMDEARLQVVMVMALTPPQCLQLK